MTRLLIALYVMGRVIRHKRNYAGRVIRFLGQRSRDSYLFRQAARDKTIGNQIGIEAWLVTLTGRRPDRPELPFLLAGLSTCYDNAVDEEGVRDWARLAAVCRGEDDFVHDDPARDALTGFRVVMAALRTTVPDVHQRVLPHLLAVHEATREGFELDLETTVDEQRLRDAAYRKGGHSMLAFSLLAVPELSPELRAATYNLGAANQLADDIYDRREDEALGLATLARLRLLGAEDRRLLETAADDLPPRREPLARALASAWGVHHLEALAWYDTGRDTATPLASVGQRTFELAIRWMPVLPHPHRP